jgi:Na+/proline symporter/signal transduction histidine kinase/CheY-like chemotaxis protein
MLNGWTIVAVALGYLGLLFAIASYGDRVAERRPRNHARPIIYALTLGVYCTSWTFFGSVGLAAKSGLDFLPIYIGPIIMIAAGWPIIRRIADLSKRQNITSIADFIAARYGKNQGLGALVAAIAVIGVLPYISLQLKAVSTSLETLLAKSSGLNSSLLDVPLVGDLALVVTITMAIFTVLFGTRHIDATEHQDGLMMAIAAESIVKLLAFLIVGTYVTFWMFGGSELLEQARATPEVSQLFTGGFDGGRWLTMTLLSMVAIILLPRQFHVAIVENASLGDIKKASWLFPLYLIAINLFVVPIAVAGLLMFDAGTTDADTFVLALPVAADQTLVSLIAFIGGLSAATAMVIVATIALSIMVCNDLVVPLMLWRQHPSADPREDMGRVLLYVRRGAIFAILGLAYCYYRMIGDAFALASIGLLSFAAIAQFAPAFFGGLIWRRATARGAFAGITAGFAMWAYTLLVPSFVDSGWLAPSLLSDGPFGIGLLRPRILFNLEFDPLTHGVLWSLACNIGAYIAFSLLSQQKPIERLQAAAFVTSDLPATSSSFRLWRTPLKIGDLMSTVARYMGEERTRRSFSEFAQKRNIELDTDAEADSRLLRFSEHLLASAVGAASSRLVLALLIERRSPNRRGDMKLLDDATDAIQYNRDLLQSAIDHVRQGIGVFDKNLELICWNRQFRKLLRLPVELGRVGVPLEDILRAIAIHTDPDADDHAWTVADRVRKLIVTPEPYQERLAAFGEVLEVRSDIMPDGGLVVTFADITERVDVAEALQEANESLERRVEERTGELMNVNGELERAKALAEAANIDKTRFLAAASHDILQPLNAARLYTSSLVDRSVAEGDGGLIRNVDASLESVEEILVTLLDISRLDAGAMKPELSTFRINELFTALGTEFEPVAHENSLELKTIPCSLTVRSDRRLLRRVLQNFISNALKYTRHGRVLMGCRRRGDSLVVQVFDTGCGIPLDQQRHIFGEFQRLESNEGHEPGLGLGLSIVERICQMLGHKIAVRSVPGKGSMFSIELPIAEALPELAPQISEPAPATASLEGLTVLCIDNEKPILDGMRVLIEGWGCHVHSSISVREAMAALDEMEASPDFVIADYHLGRGDGLTLIDQVRRKLGWNVPAVLVTADRDRLLQEEALKMGVSFMNKPLRPAALRATMAQARIRAHAAE